MRTSGSPSSIPTIRAPMKALRMQVTEKARESQMSPLSLMFALLGCGGNPTQFVRHDPSLPLDNDPANRFLSKNNRWRSSVRSVYRYMMPDFTIALVIGFVLGYGLRAIISYRRRRRARRRSYLS